MAVKWLFHDVQFHWITVPVFRRSSKRLTLFSVLYVVLLIYWYVFIRFMFYIHIISQLYNKPFVVIPQLSFQLYSLRHRADMFWSNVWVLELEYSQIGTTSDKDCPQSFIPARVHAMFIFPSSTQFCFCLISHSLLALSW